MPKTGLAQQNMSRPCTGMHRIANVELSYSCGEFAHDIRQGEFGGFASYRHSVQLLTVHILPVHGTEHRAAIQKPTAVSTAPAKIAMSTPS